MAKEITFKMSKQIIERSKVPLRSREDAILLLLYTIRMFDVSDYIPKERTEQVVVSIDKMNRLFYILDKKMFSMQFPFCIDKRDNAKKIVIYDSITRIEINPIILSFLIETFEMMNKTEGDFDTILESITNPEVQDENITINNKWMMISYLLKFDLGYLRYDNDYTHANGKMHPLNHLDICMDSAATFKIGLEKKITFSEFKNILDITKECAYMNSF